MRATLLILLLITILMMHGIAAAEDEETTLDMSPSTDMLLGGTHEKSMAINDDIKSMWTAVRQSLGNWGSRFKPATKDNSSSEEYTTNKQSITLDEKDSAQVASENHRPKIVGNIAPEVSFDNIDKEIETNANKEKLPIQMAPIEKGLVYTRPKENERWILNEEGMITWAVSSYIQSKAGEIFMNCNLYLGNRMIMSVFKGVPLIIGTESWTPPTFLQPSPEYRLRLWSQPSQIGIIDQYSAIFSIVPRKEDAFMFSYNRSVVFDNSNNNNKTDGVVIPTDKIQVGNQNDLSAPSMSEKHGHVIDVNSTPSLLNPNMPTGIYALYPSSASRVQSVNAFYLCLIFFSFNLFLNM